METAALCKPIQRFADLLRIPGTWVLTGLGQLLAALGSFPHFPQPLRLLHTHLYWRFLECQSIEVTLTQNGHLTHHEIPSVASLRPGGHFPRIGWPVSPEYAAPFEGCTTERKHEEKRNGFPDGVFHNCPPKNPTKVILGEIVGHGMVNGVPNYYTPGETLGPVNGGPVEATEWVAERPFKAQ